MSSIKLLVVGRTGVGKDTLIQPLIEQDGMTQLKSYTTRPRRRVDDESHVFITNEQAAAFPQKIAATVVNGYEYFTTPGQIEACDIFVIDPSGVYEVLKTMPGTKFVIFNIRATSEDLRKDAAIKRATDRDEAEKIFASRNADEDGQFVLFETWIDNAWKHAVNIPGNVSSISVFKNDYTDQCIQVAQNMIRSLMNK